MNIYQRIVLILGVIALSIFSWNLLKEGYWIVYGDWYIVESIFIIKFAIIICCTIFIFFVLKGIKKQ